MVKRELYCEKNLRRQEKSKKHYNANDPAVRMKERISTLDAIRGLAIFLVVLGHSVQFNVPDPFNNPVFKIIYSFHMPLFISVSGYLA